MERPIGVLTLVSRPAGATFTVDGAAVSGRKRVRVRSYSHVEVTASMPGYRPWNQRIYVRGSATAAVAVLTASPRPAPRRTR
jgi:hypothetical protein